LLDTTRTYALEKLEVHGEFDSISVRHAEYVAGELESQREMLAALPRAERVAAYSQQLSNTRSALEWSFGPRGNDEIATRLAVASTPLFMELSLLIEWQGWLNKQWPGWMISIKTPTLKRSTQRSCSRTLPTSSGF
jgi:predicted ATPase